MGHVLTYNGKIVGKDGRVISIGNPPPEPQSETWVINESPDLSSGSSIIQDINFISDNANYSNIGIMISSSPRGQEIQYGGHVVFEFGEWLMPAQQTVTFETAATGDLRAWLQSNAIKQ